MPSRLRPPAPPVQPPPRRTRITRHGALAALLALVLAGCGGATLDGVAAEGAAVVAPRTAPTGDAGERPTRRPERAEDAAPIDDLGGLGLAPHVLRALHGTDCDFGDPLSNCQ